MNTAADQVVIFRADGDSEIGMGHIMRCIGLAQEFQKRGYSPCFVSASHSGSVASRLGCEGFEYHALDATVGSEADLVQVLRIASQKDCKLLVVDGYRFGSDWLGGVTEAGVKVLLWTDYPQDIHLPVDIILDQTPADNAPMYKQISLPHTQLLCGLKYAVLRNEFLSYPNIRRTRSSIKNVLVTFGGSDSPGGTIKVLDALNEEAFQQQFDIVVGPANPHLDDIVDISKSINNAEVHVATRDMAGLIAKADLAISAAGASLWEFAYSGLPAMAMSIADNQLPLAASIERLSCGVNLGSISEFSSKKFLNVFNSLTNDPETVGKYSTNAMSLVDGTGRQRVLDLIEACTLQN